MGQCQRHIAACHVLFISRMAGYSAEILATGISLAKLELFALPMVQKKYTQAVSVQRVLINLSTESCGNIGVKTVQAALVPITEGAPHLLSKQCLGFLAARLASTFQMRKYKTGRTGCAMLQAREGLIGAEPSLMTEPLRLSMAGIQHLTMSCGMANVGTIGTAVLRNR